MIEVKDSSALKGELTPRLISLMMTVARRNGHGRLERLFVPLDEIRKMALLEKIDPITRSEINITNRRIFNCEIFDCPINALISNFVEINDDKFIVGETDSGNYIFGVY